MEEGDRESSQLVSLEGELSVLYEDEDILAVDKPAGLVVHPSGGHYGDSLANLAVGYYRKQGMAVKIRPVGRLTGTPPASWFSRKTRWRQPGYLPRRRTEDIKRRIWPWQRAFRSRRRARSARPLSGMRNIR